MALSTERASEVLAAIREQATALGFSGLGVSRVDLGTDHAYLRQWLERGHHGGMAYMARHADLRADPRQLQPGTLSVISVRLPYWPDAAPAMQVLREGSRAYISRYALGRDYHRVLRNKLRALARHMETLIGPFGHRAVADSAPVMEKALARDASLGWMGKHTVLIERSLGSYHFLGELLTDCPLPPDPRPPAENQCGACQACLRACPTGAIVAPNTLDARRCISYLTIEHHGSIPLELRPLMGNRIFGCDDCQLVCPWNRDARPSPLPDFQPRHGLDQASLLELWGWDEDQWLSRTEGMALRRLSFARWLRNLAVAMGNAPRSTCVVNALRQRIDHPDPVVREHVAWALQRQQGATD